MTDCLQSSYRSRGSLTDLVAKMACYDIGDPSYGLMILYLLLHESFGMDVNKIQLRSGLFDRLFKHSLCVQGMIRIRNTVDIHVSTRWSIGTYAQ